ncbi:uncharacterized protein LOC129953926 [Eupeodes corollae]|uniref:uncharacterized protein LOC129953926 n=1 Tax=Eupeodes corollae TaxID=290404 RepID=UPI002492197D|nr:uncharacterized protein LOC129953926 [Eupeodes corollae]
MDNIVCTANPEYAYPPKCSLDKSYNPARGFMEIQMKREIKSQRYSLNFTITNKKKKRNLLTLKNYDACAFFEGRVSAMLRIFKELLETFGELPKKCPIKKDYHYKLQNMTVSLDRFPPYFIETDFYIITRNSVGKDFLFALEFSGRVRRNEEVKKDENDESVENNIFLPKKKNKKSKNDPAIA